MRVAVIFPALLTAAFTSALPAAFPAAATPRDTGSRHPGEDGAIERSEGSATVDVPQRRMRDLRGRLRPPVRGTVVRRFREKDCRGRPSDGIMLRSRPGAQVVAPFDSTVIFARPHRDFGQLLILDTRDGYHFVLAGMTKIYGVEGQNLLEGEPVGVMSSTQGDVQVPDVPCAGGTADAPTADAGPELYFEIRHNGKPINPLPWLAADRLERMSP